MPIFQINILYYYKKMFIKLGWHKESMHLLNIKNILKQYIH